MDTCAGGTQVQSGAVGRRDVNALIQELAERQHGVVARSQLLAAGISVSAIRHRLRRRELRQLHRGVYRATLGPLPLEAETAALLACGAVRDEPDPSSPVRLCCETAAILWRLLSPSASDGKIHVSTSGRSRSPAPGIRVHRLRTLHPDDLASYQGLPTTAPARTLLDVAARLPGRELEKAVAIVEREHHVHPPVFAALLRRNPRRPGSSRLRTVLGLSERPAYTQSEAEEAFLALVRDAEGPPMEVNVRVCGYLVDFYFRRQRLVVEIDGYRFHSSRRPFRADRRRDLVLQNAGYRVARFSWEDLTESPGFVLLHLGVALGASEMRGATGS